MRESEWTRIICKQLELAGAKVLPIVGSTMQPKHWPDRLIISNCMFLVEFKGEKTELRRAQRLTIADINLRGCHAFVARWPGLLLNERDEVLGTFETGLQLLELVRGIKADWIQT